MMRRYLSAVTAHSTTVLVAVCAIFLLLFTFCYLYWLRGLGTALLTAPLVALAYGGVAWWMARRGVGVWLYLLATVLFMLVVGLAGDRRDIDYYKMRIGHLNAEGRYTEAFEIGRRSDKTDAELTALRVEALGQTGQLGSRLFEYPVAGSGRSYIGRGGDYALCGLLIDRRLDDFARMLPRYYTINDSLPKHYREALTLYCHRRSRPLVVYHNAVMDTDFDDLQALEDRYTNPTARQGAAFEQYNGTYWYYYEYPENQ